VPARLVLRGGKVVTLDARSSIASAVAVEGSLIAAVGHDAEVESLIAADTEVIELRGATVIPGMIDGHAHLDREGLKAQLPSLAGITSIEELVDRLAALARDTPPGQWIVTMPLGNPPEYRSSPEMFREGRLPDRSDLDRASSSNPIFIRPPWGYWSRQLPLIGVVNSKALALAGIDRTTQPPTPRLEIERNASGELTGRILERTHMPVAEFTLLRMAPGFTAAQREVALAESMRAYNAVGTTSVFEGHGVAPEVIGSYQRLYERNGLSVRAHLVFSPAWNTVPNDDVTTMLRSWASWLKGRGLGDDWLRVAGIYAEIDEAPEEARLRAACAPQTGWAGFCYDSGLPREALRSLLIEAARNGIRVCGIWSNLLDLFTEADRAASISGQRWILGHQSLLEDAQIANIRDLGVALTLHTNAHIYKRGDEFLRQVGPGNEDRIVPVRKLLDAGIITALSTDNVPVSMFHPVWHTVARIARGSGRVIAPEQAITPEEALRLATQHGAALSFDEQRKGSLERGKLADLAVLDQDPLTVPVGDLPEIRSRLTVVGGRVVHRS
jgi:predicted amidohydrolase YtcJ